MPHASFDLSSGLVANNKTARIALRCRIAENALVGLEGARMEAPCK